MYVYTCAMCMAELYIIVLVFGGWFQSLSVRFIVAIRSNHLVSSKPPRNNKNPFFPRPLFTAARNPQINTKSQDITSGYKWLIDLVACH